MGVAIGAGFVVFRSIIMTGTKTIQDPEQVPGFSFDNHVRNAQLMMSKVQMPSVSQPYMHSLARLARRRAFLMPSWDQTLLSMMIREQ